MYKRRRRLGSSDFRLLCYSLTNLILESEFTLIENGFQDFSSHSYVFTRKYCVSNFIQVIAINDIHKDLENCGIQEFEAQTLSLLTCGKKERRDKKERRRDERERRRDEKGLKYDYNLKV